MKHRWISLSLILMFWYSGVESQNIKFTVFNQANTPAFSTNSFRQVAVGKSKTIWAGSTGSGLYRYDGSAWVKAPSLLTHSIKSIVRALDSSIIIGQAGSNGVQATNGGVDKFPDASFSNTHWGMGAGLPSRFVNGTCISPDGKIWAACGQDLTGSTTDEGGLAYMVPGTNTFTKITTGMPSGDIRVMTVAASTNEVWAAIDRACPSTPCIPSGILRYSFNGNYLGKIDETNSPIPFSTSSIIVRGICFTPAGDVWLGFNTNNGMAVKTNGVWKIINSANSKLPAGCAVNFNAIKCDKSGKVYIGTTAGLMVYTGGSVTDPASYVLYTTANGLPSNNITGVECFSLRTLWLTTGAGVVKMEELFLPKPNGWCFRNSDVNIWPPAWYNQFNYASDPYLGGAAPFPLKAGAVLASSSFPDWPLFVDLLGEAQCYTVVAGVKTIKNLAITKYFAMTGNWDGSCQGFVETSFMAYDSIDYFRNKYTATGPWTSNYLFDLPLNAENRKVINKLMISQYQTPYINFYNTKNNVTPIQTLADTKKMLESDTRNFKGLALYNQNGSGAHIVNPYKTAKDPVEPNLEYIYVYDNNFPDDTTRKIWINTSENSWYYTISVNAGVASNEWGGPGAHKGAYLDTTARYWYQPVLLNNLSKKQPSKFLSATGTLEIYSRDSCDISITNGVNQKIGYIGGTIINTIPDAIAIRKFTTRNMAPKGYLVPEASYTARLTNCLKGSIFFSVFTSDASYIYSRDAVQMSDHDQLGLGTNGLSVRNNDAILKNTRLQTSFEGASGDMKAEISNLRIQQNASVEIMRMGDDLVKLVNNGPETSYDLDLRFVGAGSEAAFHHDSIVIPANTAHVISPDWNNLKTAIMKIFVDMGNNQSYEDTLFFGNTALPFFITNPVRLDKPKAQSTDTLYVVNSGGGVLNWTVQSGDTSWIKTPGNPSGTENGTIMVQLTQNNGASRSGILTLTAPGAANSPYYIKVTQAGKISAPGKIDASDGAFQNGVRIRWTHSDSASFYRVYRSATASGLMFPLGQWQQDTTFIDTTALKGAYYYYGVKAASDNTGVDSTELSPRDDGWRNGFTADFTWQGHCDGQPVVFTDKTQVHEKVNYSWDIGNDGTIDFMGDHCSYTFPTAGMYNVKLIISNSTATDSVVKSITVDPFPVIPPLPDTTICAGSSMTLSAGSAFSSFLWSTGATTPTVSIDSSGYGYGPASINVKVTGVNSCVAIASAYIVFDTCTQAGGYTVTGTLAYDNSESTPLNNSMIRLIRNDSIWYETTTDSNGHYSIQNLQNGTYTVSPVCNKPWGGVNSIDALRVLRHFAGLLVLDGVRLTAADVNASGSVNSVDALLMAKRFVAMINTFAAGDWAFEHPQIIVTSPGNLELNIKALVFGDVDGSYVP